MTDVPMMDLSRRHKLYGHKVDKAISRVIKKSSFILGETVLSFESELAEHCGVSYAIGVSSGTDGLLVALMALDVGPGDEVIVPSFTFFSTASAVSRLGATPVFCDVCPDTFLMTDESIKDLITDRTKAVIPVHLFGQMSDVNKIAEVLPEGVSIIEDAAQSLGALCEDGFKFDVSLCSVTSFFPTKNLGGFGDGGALLTDDPDFASKVKILRSHGANPKYTHKFIGGNFRLDAIQAAVLSVKLQDLEHCISERRVIADRYRSIFKTSGIMRHDIVSLPSTRDHAYHTFNQYVIKVVDRDIVRSRLSDMGIQTMVYYPEPLHSQECFSDLKSKDSNFPNSLSHCKQVLALPCFPGITMDEQVAVVNALKTVLSDLYPEKFIPLILFITAMWKRRSIEEITFSHMSRLKDKMRNCVDMRFLTVGSEGEESRAQAEKYGHDYIEFPNDPLGRKWNAVWNCAIEQDVDAICIIGSDDIINESAIGVYLKWIKSKSPAAGFQSVAMIDTEDKKSILWRGYLSRKRRKEPHGLGRIIKYKTALKIGRDPFPSERNSGMDGGFLKHMIASQAASGLDIIGDCSSIYCFDIKSIENIWRVDSFLDPSKINGHSIRFIKYGESISLIDDSKTQDDIINLSKDN